MADTLRDRSTRKKRSRVPSSARRSVSQRILEAVATARERRGLSLAALKKVLSGCGYDVVRNNWRVNQAVRGMVTKGSLLQATGTGASGSFRLGKMQDDQPHPAAEGDRRERKRRRRVAAARERRRGKRQRAVRQPARKAATRGRGSPRKIGKGAAARKGPRRVAARKPKGRSGLGAKGQRQRTRPRKLAKRPKEEVDEPPAQEETSLSEKEIQIPSEKERQVSLEQADTAEDEQEEEEAAASTLPAPQEERAVDRPADSADAVGSATRGSRSIWKALLADGHDVERNQARVQLAIKSLVSDGLPVQAEGTTGSFVLDESQKPWPGSRPRRKLILYHLREDQECRQVSKGSVLYAAGPRSPSQFVRGASPRPFAQMADIAPAKPEVPAAAPPEAATLPPAAKKKAAYRPQKGAAAAAVAEQILEAVAATKERQAASKLGALKKTISASGYEQPDKAGARPSQSVSTTANKGSPVESGAGTSSASLHPDREEEEEDGGQEEAEGGEDGAKGGAKSKGAAKKPARKRAAAAKPAAHKRAKKPAAKNTRKAKPRKAPKRSASSRTGGRKRRAPKRR
uniref:uncharacterized protein n=1 Tax=Pristiophorus japonicus TaxID=55135 RepID=UPI00398E7013